jgi:hypothetical protein
MTQQVKTKQRPQLKTIFLCQVSDSENEEWMTQDPGDLLHTESRAIQLVLVVETVTEPESDVMVGRVFRKKTSPSLPGKRPSSDNANNLLGSVDNVIKKTKVDVGTQSFSEKYL